MTGAASDEKTSRRADWEQYWEHRHDVGEVYSNEDRIIRNLQTVTDLSGKSVLEVGAGTGRDSFPLVRAGAKVTQLDYSHHSLLILRKLASSLGIQTRIVGGDCFHLPFRDETFDIVFHQGLLEHFRKPFAHALLRENIRVLKPNGILLVDVPQRWHLYTLAKHLLISMNKWFAGWERSFSVGELRRELSRMGLVPIRSYGEWMYPSFLYRVLRELLKKAGVSLPLSPSLIPSLTEARRNIRLSLLKTALPLYSGISIGVIASKGTVDSPSHENPRP